VVVGLKECIKPPAHNYQTSFLYKTLATCGFAGLLYFKKIVVKVLLPIKTVYICYR